MEFQNSHLSLLSEKWKCVVTAFYKYFAIDSALWTHFPKPSFKRAETGIYFIPFLVRGQPLWG